VSPAFKGILPSFNDAFPGPSRTTSRAARGCRRLTEGLGFYESTLGSFVTQLNARRGSFAVRGTSSGDDPGLRDLTPPTARWTDLTASPPTLSSPRLQAARVTDTPSDHRRCDAPSSPRTAQSALSPRSCAGSSRRLSPPPATWRPHQRDRDPAAQHDLAANAWNRVLLPWATSRSRTP